MLEPSRARYFQIILEFKNTFGIEDKSYSYLSMQLKTAMSMMVAQ